MSVSNLRARIEPDFFSRLLPRVIARTSGKAVGAPLNETAYPPLFAFISGYSPDFVLISGARTATKLHPSAVTSRHLPEH